MSGHPSSIDEEALALEAAGDMEARKITFLIVTREGAPCGVIHIHDLLAAKVL
jgi:arabinose-5-phosphate isomerase